MFFGFSLFVFLFMLAAWQVAAAELAELKSQPRDVAQKKHTELALFP